MPYDFLEVYDYENSKSNCEQICSYFDEVYNISDQSSKSSGLSYFNKKRQKICDTKSFNFGEDWACNEIVYSFISDSISSYVKKYSFLETLNKGAHWRLCPSYNIQRYEGEKEGFFTLHNENSGSHPYRMLVWMVYLNDAKCGTKFPYQDKTVTPKTGRTVIWPAGWTHPHHGIPAPKELSILLLDGFIFFPKEMHLNLMAIIQTKKILKR